MIGFLNKWKTEGYEELKTPKKEKSIFDLKYKRLRIGVLKLEHGIWSFRYSDEFKQQNKLKPLPDFPNVNRVYENKELYPFFLHRIPSTKQPKVQKAIKKHQLDATNIAALLQFFGLRSISNPFVLLPLTNK